jgi:hypothetical protein
MKAPSIFVSAIAALQFLSCQIFAASASRTLDTVQCPLTAMHTHLYVEVALDGQVKPNWWLVDTGSPWSLVSAKQAKRLIRSAIGISERTATVAGENCTVLVNIGAKVGGYPMGRFDFFESAFGLGLMDRNHYNVGYRDSFEPGGVLGVNFLAQRGALLNFQSQRLFFVSGSASLGLNRTGFEREGFTYVPVRVTSAGRIEAIGSVGSNIYSFLIDSGSDGTVLQLAIKEAARIPFWSNGIVYFGLGQGYLRAARGQLSSFKLGTQDVSGKIIQFANLPNLHTGFSHPFGGIIGEDLLWAHQAILDIGGRALYLKPSPRKKG